MANRFQIRQYDLAYNFIKARDGEHCLVCGYKPRHGTRLEIDHADADPNNWDPENLHLLCKQCNIKKRGLTIRQQKSLIRHHSANNVSEREKARGVESTHLVRELVDYRSGSIEMQANSYYELNFRDWILGMVTMHGFIPKKEAIESGAEVTGCSSVTTTRYLAKMTSSVGNLMEELDPLGVKVIKFKR